MFKVDENIQINQDEDIENLPIIEEQSIEENLNEIFDDYDAGKTLNKWFILDS